MRLMRYLFWLLLGVLFLLLLLFAYRNTGAVRLHFFFDQGWDLPLILLLLVFFVIGVSMGVLASLERIFRQRRELIALKKELAARNRPVAVPTQPADPGAG